MALLGVDGLRRGGIVGENLCEFRENGRLRLSALRSPFLGIARICRRYFFEFILGFLRFFRDNISGPIQFFPAMEGFFSVADYENVFDCCASKLFHICPNLFLDSRLGSANE
jgi:hypothetical protein